VSVDTCDCVHRVLGVGSSRSQTGHRGGSKRN